MTRVMIIMHTHTSCPARLLVHQRWIAAASPAPARLLCSMAAMDVAAAPAQHTSMERTARFLATADISELEKPLVFENNRSSFKKLLCCQGALVRVWSWGSMARAVHVCVC